MIFMIWVMLFLVLGVTRRYIVYLFFSAVIAFSSLAIIRDSDVFFNCSVRIEAFSVASSVSTLNPVRAVDRFSVVLSAFAKSFLWRSIYCFNS